MTWKRLTMIGSSVGLVIAGVAAALANVNTITSAGIFNIASRLYVDDKVDAINVQLAGEVGDLKALVKTLGNMTADSNVGQLEVRLEVARNVLRDAKRDLADNPTVPSLQRLVTEAEADIEKLEMQVQLALCYRIEIISEQDQGCRSQ